MERSRLRLRGVAILVAILAGAVVVAAGGGQRPPASDIEKRLAALEAGQKAILKELEEITVLLRTRAAAVPSPAPQPQPSPANAVQNLTGPPPFDLDIAGAPTKGRPDAKLVVVEFSDFQCPFCGRYTRETLPQVERDYVEAGKIRYVFRHLPLERLHPLALRASEAGDCAHQQSKFWPMHTRLFGNQMGLGEADLTRSAEALGLDMPLYQRCMVSQSTAPARVRQDQAEGLRAGITGTPTFFIGTMTPAGKVHVLKRMVGAQPYASFKTTLDGLLGGADSK